jgi:hypothetical protein
MWLREPDPLEVQGWLRAILVLALIATLAAQCAWGPF